MVQVVRLALTNERALGIPWIGQGGSILLVILPCDLQFGLTILGIMGGVSTDHQIFVATTLSRHIDTELSKKT